MINKNEDTKMSAIYEISDNDDMNDLDNENKSVRLRYQWATDLQKLDNSNTGKFIAKNIH